MVKLNPKDCLSIRNDILKTDYTKAYKNKAINLLKSISKFEYNFYNFNDNSKQLQLIPINSDNIKDYTIWTPAEFEYFICFVENPISKAFFIFLHHTGARVGEAKVLWSQILLTGLPAQVKA